MKVFKFGGASVKDAESIKNVVEIVKNHRNGSKLLLIVSAMGKTTNGLEKIAEAYFKKNNAEAVSQLNEIKQYHNNIASGLFKNPSNPVFEALNNTFVEIEWMLEEEPQHAYDFIYDQIVSTGELLSSHILNAYLNETGNSSKWLDARDCIKTDNTYREGKVQWIETISSVQRNVDSIFRNFDVIVTQGFIGVTSENYTTTLGREGSDYTAAIFAHALEAESVTIWKDVPGVLNADPKWFSETEKLEQLSYYDAIELAYYGATVIHPKTIKPIQNKDIPLYVKSFVDSNLSGTTISKDSQTEPLIPTFIFKVNQVLLSISAKDFSFVVEEHLSEIFSIFSGLQIKVNLMQLSAISFSACFDYDRDKVSLLIEKLSPRYKTLYNKDLELVTVRHYNQQTLERVTEEKIILLEQKSRHTAQIVMKPM